MPPIMSNAAHHGERRHKSHGHQQQGQSQKQQRNAAAGGGSQQQKAQQYGPTAFSSLAEHGVSKEEYGHAVVRQVVGGICKHAGFARAEQSAVDVLTEIMERCMCLCARMRMCGCG